MGLRGTNGIRANLETRGRDEVQEEQHDERKPGEGGHRRRGRKLIDWKEATKTPPRGFVADWTKKTFRVSARSTSRDVRLTSCEFGKTRSGLAPSQNILMSSHPFSLSSSTMAYPSPGIPHFQQDSQKAQEGEILHGYVHFNSRISTTLDSKTHLGVLKSPRQNSDSFCYRLQRWCNSYLGCSPPRLSLEAIQEAHPCPASCCEGFTSQGQETEETDAHFHRPSGSRCDHWPA